MSEEETLISYSELSKHNNEQDLWIVVNGHVYDMTTFAPTHPGGSEIIAKYAGSNATAAYSKAHSPSLISTTLTESDKKGKFDEASAPSNWNVELEKAEEEEKIASEIRAPLSSIINLNDFAEIANKALAPKDWGYISSGSNDNITRDANRSLYEKIWFRPRVLRDVASINTKSKILGQDVSLPIMISPMGMSKHGGPDGELALSRGAASSGVILTISTYTSYSLEQILAEAPPTQPFFFQLYVNKDKSKTEALLKDLIKYPQIKAVLLTIDLPVVSKREGDERSSVGTGTARNIGSAINPSLTWHDIKWIKDISKLPVLVKGVQGAADALQAAHFGCAGVVVSNHGGRALDGAPPAILTLLEIRKLCPEVFDVMEVWIDGGIRRGSDVLKALCLGATAVGIGRPFMYSLGYGQAGVEHAVTILKDELATAMKLCGVMSIEDASMDYLNTGEVDHLIPPQIQPHFKGKARL